MLRSHIAILLGILLFPVYASANNLAFNLLDNKQKPLNNAVVYAIPLNPQITKLQPQKATIVQSNKTFLPNVSIFSKGTVATFLNKDSVKHHVYSFSTPKKFEIKLYSGKPAKTITFDKSGIVTFGCNIHDDMLAYAFIVDTPHYGLSNSSGRAVLKNLPDGVYMLNIQHPQQKKGVNIQQKISLPSKVNSFSYKLALKPQWKKRKKKKTQILYNETESN